jgi:membrane protein DedA with SNARE-associated domain
LALAAVIEYIFPPFPGDTVTLLGGVYAVRGQKPWALVLAAVTLGSLVGASFDYWVGSRLYRWIRKKPEDFTLLGLKKPQLLELEEKMRRRGAPLILFNRFLPGVRGVLFFAAGASGMPYGKALGLGAISAVAFNLLVMGLGIALGGNAEKLEGLIRHSQLLVASLFGAALLAWGLWTWAQKRKGLRKV